MAAGQLGGGSTGCTQGAAARHERADARLRGALLTAALLATGLLASACNNGHMHGSAATPTPVPTLVPTLIGVPVDTATTTPEPEPTAMLQANVSNGAATRSSAVLSGTRLSGPPASGAATTYGPLEQEVDGNGSAAANVPGLAPGMWLHQVTVAATGQQQFRKSLVIADPSTPNTIAWTLFSTVLSVNQAGDDGNGVCDATCTLRDAATTASTSPAPVLITFDHAALGNPAYVMAIERRIDITSPGLMIDGSDSNGDPSPVADFAERVFPTQITMRATHQPVNPPPSTSCPCEDDYGGTLFASAPGVVFTGLHVVRIYPRHEENICCGDLTLIEFGVGAANGAVDTCLLDGGGRGVTNARTPEGETGPATSKDCVKPENTGSTPDRPIVVANSELSYCLDRGVKVKDDFVRLEDNWIHNNLRCALFSIVPGGNIEAVGNLIEENGMNCPRGAPPNCTDQVVTRPDAPQVSAQGESTQFRLDGNVVRSGPLIGVYWQVGSTGTLANTFVCGMGASGIRGERDHGAASDAVVRGTASVLNASSGALFTETVGADLGTDGGADAGNNAFAGNPPNAQVRNELSNLAPIAAKGNQWESCYPSSGANPDQCDVTAIGDDDTNNRPGTFDFVEVQDPQPQQSSGGIALTSADPTSTVQGRLVGLTGTGFDAITGVAGLTSADCAKLATTNTCSPLNGTCVEFLIDGVWTEAADVLGVTPTFIMVRSPLTCTAPIKVRVRRAVLGGGEVVSNELDFCVN